MKHQLGEALFCKRSVQDLRGRGERDRIHELLHGNATMWWKRNILRQVWHFGVGGIRIWNKADMILEHCFDIGSMFRSKMENASSNRVELLIRQYDYFGGTWFDRCTHTLKFEKDTSEVVMPRSSSGSGRRTPRDVGSRAQAWLTRSDKAA